MPFPAFILLVATFLPLASAGVLTFFGNRMGGPKTRGGGTAVAGWVATTAVAGSFLCSLLAMYQWFASGTPGSPWGWKQSAVLATTRWLPVGDGAAGPGSSWLDVGLYVDSLTIAMFAMVTLVALLVHVFAIGYMRGDARFPRFFAHLSLFCFAMLGLLIAGTLVQVFVFWELVGLCSYLLIGFWTDRKAAGRAATKAFLVNRVGDAAFLVGFGLLFLTLGNATLPNLWAALGGAGRGGPVTLADGSVVSAGLLTAIGVCLFVGAAGKSAQFPLHTWLPDAMEGPTPVSALIHAATMVAAGVYLVARVFPLLTPDAKLVVAIVGCVTLAIGALVALVQTDIKRALAYSTISQLGYMMLAIGVGSWAGGLFHLITHAFFKALLFLGAGSVIHAARHQQDMRQYGGLWRQIPVTAASFLVGVLAMSGAGIELWGGRLGLAGYYSKSHVLTDAAAFAGWATTNGRPSAYWLLLAVPVVIAYVTPFYMARIWMLTFWGRPRNVPLYGRARETALMYVPLMALAFMSAIAGWQIMNVRPLLDGAVVESRSAVNHSAPTPGPTPADGWASAWPSYPPGMEPRLNPARTEGGVTARGGVVSLEETPSAPPTPRQQAHATGAALEHRYVAWAWPLGVVAAVLFYCRGLGVARRLVALPVVRPVHAWLLRGMYLDELFDVLIVRPVRFLASLAAWLDRHVVDAAVNRSAAVTRRLAKAAGWNDRHVFDGAVVGVGQLAWELGTAARAPQTGRIRLYVTALFAIVVVGLAVTVGVMVWK